MSPTLIIEKATEEEVQIVATTLMGELQSQFNREFDRGGM